MVVARWRFVRGHEAVAQESVQSIFPRVRRLVLAIGCLSLVSFAAQVRAERHVRRSGVDSRFQGQVAQELHDDFDNHTRSGDARLAESSNERRYRWRRKSTEPAFASFPLVLLQLPIVLNVHSFRRSLRLLTALGFVGLLSSLTMLLNRAQALPGGRHLLSSSCPMPIQAIRRQVQLERHQFHLQLVSGFPPAARSALFEEASSSRLRGANRIEHDLPGEPLWPLRGLPDDYIDLCSVSWAIGNMYMMSSIVVTLRLLVLLRSVGYPASPIGRLGNVLADFRSGTHSPLRMAASVFGAQAAWTAHGRSPALAGPADVVQLGGARGQQFNGGSLLDDRNFVPFSGRPRKLEDG